MVFPWFSPPPQDVEQEISDATEARYVQLRRAEIQRPGEVGTRGAVEDGYEENGLGLTFT